MSSKSKTLVVDSFKELPDQLKRRILKAGISTTEANENIEVVLNILHFKTKYNIYTSSMYERRKSQNYKRYNSGHSLISDEIVSVNDFDEELEALIDQTVGKKNYKIVTQVGKGGFGRVLLYKSIIDDESIAIKRTPHNTEKQKRKNFQEIRFLIYCKHPNIVKYIRSTIYSNEMWIVTEYLNGGTLSQVVGVHKFSEPEIVYITKQVLQGLEFLHENQLAHRDLKSGNIMLDLNGNVKLIDFGLCSDISQGQVVHMVGSPFWMPPEMIQRKPHGLPVDIWSFGICIMEMANGHPPHRKSSIRAMFECATVGYPEPLSKKHWSEFIREFISRCLVQDPEDRWTVKQLLQHEFLECEAEKTEMTELFKTLMITNRLKLNGV